MGPCLSEEEMLVCTAELFAQAFTRKQKKVGSELCSFSFF